MSEEGGTALVPELAVLVLPERDLPRPLAVVGDAPANDSRATTADEPPAANVLVSGLWAQRVEERPLAV